MANKITFNKDTFKAGRVEEFMQGRVRLSELKNEKKAFNETHKVKVEDCINARNLYLQTHTLADLDNAIQCGHSELDMAALDSEMVAFNESQKIKVQAAQTRVDSLTKLLHDDLYGAYALAMKNGMDFTKTGKVVVSKTAKSETLEIVEKSLYDCAEMFLKAMGVDNVNKTSVNKMLNAICAYDSSKSVLAKGDSFISFKGKRQFKELFCNYFVQVYIIDNAQFDVNDAFEVSFHEFN